MFGVTLEKAAQAGGKGKRGGEREGRERRERGEREKKKKKKITLLQECLVLLLKGGSGGRKR